MVGWRWRLADWQAIAAVELAVLAGVYTREQLLTQLDPKTVERIVSALGGVPPSAALRGRG